jgi:hypothetical protein
MRLAESVSPGTVNAVTGLSLSIPSSTAAAEPGPTGPAVTAAVRAAQVPDLIVTTQANDHTQARRTWPQLAVKWDCHLPALQRGSDSGHRYREGPPQGSPRPRTGMTPGLCRNQAP